MEIGTGGLIVRIILALLSAILGGWWLWQSLRHPDPKPGRLARAIPRIVLILCGFWSAVWLAIALIRLRYPFELEWSSGAMRDMAVRAMRGEPLYIATGGGWFPYEYPPLYAWLSGMLFRVTNVSYIPMRIISIASTVGCAWILYAWVRTLTLLPSSPGLGAGRPGNPQSDSPSAASETRTAIRNPQFWPLVATGLFLAAYRLTGAWYDIERIDMLFLFLSLVGIYWLHLGLASGQRVWTAASAAAFALAFLTKQQAVLFILGGIGALTFTHQWRQLVVFAGLAFLLCATASLALNSATGGWFVYYCFRVPMSNGIKLHLATHYIPADLALYAPLVAIAIIAIMTLRCTHADYEPDMVLLGWMTAMAIAGSMLSRAHWGGDQNVLIPEYAFLGALACVLAGRMTSAFPATYTPLYALVLAQLLTLTYRPQAQLPTAVGRAAGERYKSLIRGLERNGEVLCLDHGGFTAAPHFQILGLMDVMNTEKRLPEPVAQDLRAHRYAAIVMDSAPTITGPLGEIVRNYPHADRIGITDTWDVTGFLTPNPARPVYVLRP